MQKLFYGCVILFFCAADMAHATSYQVNKAASAIHFSGIHAEKPFRGTFEKWDARIMFNPDALETSRVEVTIDTASAKTGDKIYDGTLPAKDWFNVIDYPNAQFLSTTIEPTAQEHSYVMKGNLTIKNITIPVQFPFTLSDEKKSPITTQFSFILNRLDVGLGVESDAEAEWVDKEIKVDVVLVATPNPL